jgi:transcriptional regulator with XRE-family HTH domain
MQRGEPLARHEDEFLQRPPYARSLLLRRVAAGLRLEDLAQRTGIDITALSRYENGVHVPGKVNRARIDAALEEAAQ